MNEVYNREYYENYNAGIGQLGYKDSASLKAFLDSVAQHIVDTLHPKTVLDAGCAMGHLVAALRDRGVEAYGIDISEYAVENVRTDIKPYCFVGSLAETFPKEMPKHYDLVVTIEVLEHLSETDGKKAIQNLCNVSETVLFSSTPDEYEDETHINVQEREYWSDLFAKNGFFADLFHTPSYVTDYAVCYRKCDDILQVLQEYEKRVQMQKKDNKELWTKLDEAMSLTVKQDKELQRHLSMVHERDAKILEQIEMIKERDQSLLKHIEMVHERDAKIQRYEKVLKR